MHSQISLNLKFPNCVPNLTRLCVVAAQQHAYKDLASHLTLCCGRPAACTQRSRLASPNTIRSWDHQNPPFHGGPAVWGGSFSAFVRKKQRTCLPQYMRKQKCHVCFVTSKANLFQHPLGQQIPFQSGLCRSCYESYTGLSMRNLAKLNIFCAHNALSMLVDWRKCM